MGFNSGFKGLITVASQEMIASIFSTKQSNPSTANLLGRLGARFATNLTMAIVSACKITE